MPDAHWRIDFKNMRDHIDNDKFNRTPGVLQSNLSMPISGTWKSGGQMSSLDGCIVCVLCFATRKRKFFILPMT